MKLSFLFNNFMEAAVDNNPFFLEGFIRYVLFISTLIIVIVLVLLISKYNTKVYYNLK